MALVETKAYVDPIKSTIDMSHDENENVVLIISVWEGLGSQKVPYRLNIEKIRMKIKGKATIDAPVFAGEIFPWK